MYEAVATALVATPLSFAFSMVMSFVLKLVLLYSGAIMVNGQENLIIVPDKNDLRIHIIVSNTLKSYVYFINYNLRLKIT